MESNECQESSWIALWPPKNNRSVFGLRTDPEPMHGYTSCSVSRSDSPLLGSSPSKQKGVLDFKCTNIISPKNHTINLGGKKTEELLVWFWSSFLWTSKILISIYQFLSQIYDGQYPFLNATLFF